MLNKKVFLVIFLIFEVATSAKSFLNDDMKEKLYDQVISTTKWVMRVKEEVPIEEDVKFYLYTKSEPDKENLLTFGDAQLIKDISSFNASYPLVFVVHGWGDHKGRGTIVKLRTELLKNIITNVIVVDWKRLAAQVYFHAAFSVQNVGTYLSQFVIFLQKEFGVSLDKVHFIGHSLGAQVAGQAGYLLNGTIGRITGLDPAGPMYEFLYVDEPMHSLQKSDGKFVDIIHTAAEDFGLNEPSGDADFYPNDGIVPQPGCTNVLSSISCSHVRSVEFFTESIGSKLGFWATKCDSWVNWRLLRDCNLNQHILMGYHTPKSARGNFFVRTKSKSPFALGENGLE